MPDFASQFPLARPGSRVILVGTGEHPAGSTLPPVAAIGTSLNDLADALQNHASVPRGNITLVLDPQGPLELGKVLDVVVAASTDVLLVYFAGHGLVGDGGELYLATSATDDPFRGLEYTALPYRTLLRIIRSSAAGTVAVILDCCFAGRAGIPAGPAGIDAIFEQAPLQGGLVLASAARDEHALAAPGERHTKFTGSLIHLLRRGDPDGPREITLNYVYRYLSQVLPEQDAPLPHLRASDRAADLILAPNPAYQAGVTRRPGEPPADVPCPFRGLRSFRPEDARYFFGRDDVVSEVVAGVLAGGRLIPLIGPSGCGKTSLLRAGVVPQMLSRGWTVTTMTPGTDPVNALNRRAEALADRDSAMLIIDQFEELFTATAQHTDRFITRLADIAGGGLTVLTGLRADFYAQFIGFPFLADALRARQIIVAPVSQHALRSVIEKPAEAAGLRLEEGLADTLLEDAGARPGRDQSVLPLLSHALRETWQRRSGNLLTLVGYRDTGGIAGAVARSAEQVFAEMNAGDQQSLRDLALRMVHLSADTEDTRRRLELAGLTRTERRVIDVLAVARLVTVDEEHAEFAHDALLSAWPRLRRWIDENRVALVAAHQLDEAAREWERAGHQDAYLFQGPRLGSVAATIEGASGEVRPTAAALRFLDASRERQRADERAAHSRMARRRATLAVICALVLVAGLVGVVSVHEGRLAAQHAAVVRSTELAADAEATAVLDPGLAAQLAVAAYHLSPTQDATTELYTLLNRPMDQVIGDFGGSVVQVAAQMHGPLAAADDNEDALRVWDISDSSAPELVATIHPGSDAIALAPRSPLLAAGCPGNGRLCLWNLAKFRAPALTARLPLPSRLGGTIASMAFSPDGTLLAAADTQGSALLWSVASPARPRLLGLLNDRMSNPSLGVGTVAFSPDGRTLAQTIEGGSALLWSLASPAHPDLEINLGGGYRDLAFNPAGTLLAASNDTGVVGSIGLWKIVRNGKPVPVRVGTETAIPDAQELTVAFSRDGNTLAYGGEQPIVGSPGFLATLDVSPAGMADGGLSLPGMWDTGFGMSSLASTSGGTLLSGGDDGVVRLWNVPAGVAADATANDNHLLDMSQTGHLMVAPLPVGTATVTSIWDISVPTAPVLESTLPVDPIAASFLGSTRGLLILNQDYSAELWNVANPRHPVQAAMLGWVDSSLVSQGLRIESVTTNTAGNLVAVLGTDGKLRLWRVAASLRPTLVGAIPVPDLKDEQAGILPDGRMAVVLSPEGIQWWDIRDPAHPVSAGFSLLPNASTGSDMGSGGTFAATSQLNLTCGCSGLHVFDVSGEHVTAPATLSDAADLMYVSGDGRLLASSGSGGNGLTLWDTSNPGRPRVDATLTTVPAMLGITFSAEGTRMVDWNSQTLQLWDITNPAAPVLEASFGFSDQPDDIGMTSSMWTAAFAPSGPMLAVSLYSAVVLINTDPASLARYYCSVTSTITSAEWSVYAKGIPYQDPCSVLQSLFHGE